MHFRFTWSASVAAILVAIPMLALGLNVGTAQAAARPAVKSCSPSFIGVAGSGQNKNGTMVSNEVSGVGDWLVVDAANLGKEKLRNWSLLTYPAVPVLQYVSLHHFDNLDTSEKTGETKLLGAIKADRAASTKADCPDAPILLAGYSQGSEVIIRAVDAEPLSVRNTISIVLLGNPSFLPHLSQDLDLNTGLVGSGLEGVRPRTIGQHFNLKTDVIDRTLDICANNDPICADPGFSVPVLEGLLTGRDGHFHYLKDTVDGEPLIQIAGDFLWFSSQGYDG